MLKATIDTEIFKEAVEVVAAIVTECRLNISANGFTVRAVDTANVAMISLELGAPAFSAYSAGDSQIGLDIGKMKTVVGMMEKGDSLSLDLPEGAYKMELEKTGGLHYEESDRDTHSCNTASLRTADRFICGTQGYRYNRGSQSNRSSRGFRNKRRSR